MRQYQIKFNELKEILYDEMLPKEDPKLALAKVNYDGPVEINEADYSQLIRVPGIGPGSANKIVNMRERFKKYQDLNKLGIRINRAKPFIKVDGKWQKRSVDF